MAKPMDALVQQLHLEVASFYQLPEADMVSKSCCNYCASILHGSSFKCKDCGAHWCCSECHELDLLKTHDDSCEKRMRLMQGQWSDHEKSTYLSQFQALLPPCPPVASVSPSEPQEKKISESKDNTPINPTQVQFIPSLLPDSVDKQELMTALSNHLSQQFKGVELIGAHENHSGHGHHYYYYRPYHRHPYFFPRFGWLSFQDTFWALAILNGLVASRS